MLTPRRANIVHRAETINPFEIHPTTGLDPGDFHMGGRAVADAMEPLPTYNLVDAPLPIPQIPAPRLSNKNQLIDGTNQFYNDYLTQWGTNPIYKESTPMLTGDIANPTYSDNTLAAINKVRTNFVNGSNKEFPFESVSWTNKGGGNVIPVIRLNGSTVPLESVIQPDEFQGFMDAANVPNYYSTKQYNALDPASLLGKEKRFDNGFYKVWSNDIPVDNSGYPMRKQMHGVGQELADINRLQQQALNSRGVDSVEIYRGGTDEPGLDAIIAAAKRGGNGRWVDDNAEPMYNLFQATVESQGDSMVNSDFARGGRRISVGGVTSALPITTDEDYVGDRIGFSNGYPVDVRGVNPVPQGVRNFTPASELLEPAAQWKFQSQRETLRFPTVAETPLTLAAVNEYGIAQYPGNPANAFPGGGRIALSVQKNNRIIDTNPERYPTGMVTGTDGRQVESYGIDRLAGMPSMASRGRWMGGGLSDAELAKPHLPNSGKLSGREGLDGNYKIPGNYLRLLPDDDPRTLAAEAANIEAHQAAANYQEPATLPPFTRQYQITQTGREIEGAIPSGQIAGAYLPVSVEIPTGQGSKIERDWMPYAPGLAPEELRDQHLADLHIELDGAKYPLTSEATTSPYIPSPDQKAEVDRYMYGKTKVRADDSLDWWNQEGPSDADLAAIANQGKLNFNAGDDVKNARAKRVGLATEYNDPNIAPVDIQSALDASRQKLNTVRALITNYETSPTVRQKTEPLFNSVDPSLNRFMNEDEANKIGQMVTIKNANGDIVDVRPASSFTKKREVVSDDGTTYLEDVDFSPVNQRDLANIFSSDRQPMNLPELRAEAARLEGEIARASNAYNQAMGIESQPEIQITATPSIRKAQTLADQAKQLGMQVNNNDGQVVITGSLPFDSNLRLPFKRNVFTEVDPKTQAMYQQGKADEIAAQKLIDVAQGYRQEQRMNQIGYPSKPQLIDQPTADYLQQQIIQRAATQAMSDRKADYFGNELATMLSTPTPDSAAQRVYRQWNAGERMGRSAKQAQQYSVSEPVGYVSDVFPNLPHITQEPIDNSAFDNPGYVPTATERNIPSWAIPAALGGVYVAAAGANEYQRQQEAKQRQQEAELRKLYGVN